MESLLIKGHKSLGIGAETSHQIGAGTWR